MRGFFQHPGIDFDKTFCSVLKPSTIRVVLTIAASHSWPIHQLDVKNAFLHGDLNKTVLYEQSSVFLDPRFPHHVCRLHKSLYGLKQTLRAWYQRFALHAHRLGFVASRSNASIFVLKHDSDLAYLLLYVDDIILTASSTSLLHNITNALHSEFTMVDLGDLRYFLGISVSRSSTGVSLSQHKYAEEILHCAGMTQCNPAATPVDTHPKLSSSDGDLVSDPTDYRSLAGALQYLTLTRPDIAYAVQQVCLHMHAPRTSHFNLVKQILQYVKGTLDFRLHLHVTSLTTLTAYSDVN